MLRWDNPNICKQCTTFRQASMVTVIIYVLRSWIWQDKIAYLILSKCTIWRSGSVISAEEYDVRYFASRAHDPTNKACDATTKHMSQQECQDAKSECEYSLLYLISLPIHSFLLSHSLYHTQTNSSSISNIILLPIPPSLST